MNLETTTMQAFTDCQKVNLAAYEVLQKWNRGMDSKEKAFCTLKDALIGCGFVQLATRVLK